MRSSDLPSLAAIVSVRQYRQHFRDPGFGMLEAAQLSARLGLGHQAPRRRIAGSNLLFRLGSVWLKLAPPWWADSLNCERLALSQLQQRLPVPIPRLLGCGMLGSWPYLLLSHVDGVPHGEVAASLRPEETLVIADDCGALITALHAVTPWAFVRGPGSWTCFLDETLARLPDIHAERGTDAATVGAICAFVAEHAAALRRLEGSKLLHADLTSEHVLLGKRQGVWRVVGLIDFADMMVGPREYDLLLPLVQLMPGQGPAQQRLLTRCGLSGSSVHCENLLALTLCYRFIHFRQWFAPWLQGALDLRLLARQVFPQP